MKQKRIIFSILVIILVLFAIILFLSFRETAQMKNLKEYSVNIAKCYSSCPIEGDESVAHEGEIFYYINLSCRSKCHETYGDLTLGDIANMNLSREDSEKFSVMIKEIQRCIQGYAKEEISFCLDGFIQKYS